MSVRKHFEEVGRVRDSGYLRLGIALAVVGWLTVAGIAIAFEDARHGAIAVLLIPASLPLLPLTFKRWVRVDDEGVHAKFDWVNFGKIDLPLDEIEDHRLAPMPPKGEWSQQPKDDVKKIRVLWARSNDGVLIKMNSGKRVWISSQSPMRFKRAITKARNRHRGVL